MTLKNLRRLMLVALLASSQVFAEGPAREDAAGAFPKLNNATFYAKHDSFLARGKSGPVGLLFLGDSITEGWKGAPHIWEAYYGKYQPANFGISGDRTQHVIWRIEQGELEGIVPKVAVLMIGTNNSGDYSAAEITAANRKIVSMMRAKLPQTKILLLAIFPRGAHDRNGNPLTPAMLEQAAQRSATIDAVNREMAKLDDGKTVRFLDINKVFVGQDGRIPYAVMPDQLHPVAAGYQLWADAMNPLLMEMMK
jgi:lysophospholipase L1-like esterase